MKKCEITPALLNSLLTYDPGTGFFMWKSRAKEFFASERSWRSWNSKHAGKRAFTSKHVDGHHQARVCGAQFTGAHRLAWAMHYGEWPKNQIDHINGDPADNRIENLRDVPLIENRKNQKVRSDNSSGRVGVFWDKRRCKWASHIGVDGKTKFLGYFNSVDDASVVRALAEREHGYHGNHGRRGIA